LSYHELRVSRVIDETHDTRSYVLEIPPELRERFAYRAGQYLTFEVPLGPERIVRCYSLASSPDVGDSPKFTVKRVAGGRGSNWFHEAVAAGARLRVLPPLGRFVLHESAEGLLLFAGGSGITPVISLIKSALATTSRRIGLLYANRDERSVIFRRELDALAAKHAGRLELRHHLDDADGFVTADEVRAAAEGFEDAECYLCGPGPFMAGVEATLRAAGVPGERIRIERFELPADHAQTGVTTEAPAPAAGLPSELVVHLEGQTHRVPYTPGQTILAAVRAAGLSPPFACEGAFCGSCAAKRLRGEVALDRNDVFNAQELVAGWILTCHGRPASAECEISWDP
jgi:3-ketosteroid 9alpha-monooxygenase subunit B